MNLHEYQAKELLKKYKVPVQEGFACGTVHEAEEDNIITHEEVLEAAKAAEPKLATIFKELVAAI